MSHLMRSAEHYAETEEEALRRKVRLHAHLGLQLAGLLVLAYVLTADMGEMVLVTVTCCITNTQEIIDFLGRL
jgi:hypothetical protein